jgi:pilus assembly protein CpaB
MEMKPKVILIIALVLGLITSGAVYFMMDNMQGEPVAKKTVSVVVATKDIQPRMTIEEGLVKVKQMPKEMVHPQAINSLSEVKGNLVLKKIIAGEQILKPRLLNEKGDSPGLAFNLEPSQRAVTVAVNEVIGVAGFLTPGDHVDVVGVFTSNSGDEAIAKTVLQNIKVLAVAQDMVNGKDQEPKVTKSVTLAADLKDAEKLILADARGDIRLALRSVKNKSNVVTDGIKIAEIIKQEDEPTERYQEVSPKVKDAPISKELDRDRSAKQNGEVTKENQAESFTTKVRKKREIKKEIEIIRGAKKNYIQVPMQ